jgi:glycosyltransferase involved in cell wall biosynthesis
MEEVKCGGAELSFFTLTRALSTRCEVHLAVSEEALRHPVLRASCEALDHTMVTIHPTKAPLNAGTFSNLHPRFRASAASELAGLIKRTGPDVILVNLPTVERGQAVVDAAELCTPRPPVWGFLHLTQPPTVIGAKLGLVRDFMVPKLIRRFDRLLTVSRSGSREIAERYRLTAPDVLQPPTRGLSPLPPGSNRSQLRQAEGLSDGFLLGMVGRVQIHHKGQDAALRITRELLSRGLKLQLVIVGDGPDRRWLQRKAERLGIASALRFLGWRDDVERLMPLLDAVLMPSRYEGFPQVAVQAVTAYVPVVGYAVGGLAELVPEGFTAAPGDEAGLAAIVGALASEPRSWPAREVALRAATWCDPGNVADGLLVLMQRAGMPRAAAGSAAQGP